MATTTDLARWMRDQHDRVDHLVDRLTERVAFVPRANREPWLKALVAEFEEFRANLEKHFALEEKGGYLASVLQARPGAHEEVDHLLAEHREISRLLTAIFEEVSSLHPSTPLHIRDMCCRVRNLIEVLDRHESHENMLVSYTITRDIGSHD